MNYQWDWAAFFYVGPDGVHTYAQDYAFGVLWTLTLAASAIAVGLTMGSVIALMRVSPYRALRAFATGFVELFRNIPLIVLLFLWYFVMPEVLPQKIGNAIKEMGQPWSSFIPAFLCLGTYAAARMSEVIRAGIQSLSQGQFFAARAIGLSEPQAFRYVILPQSFRIVIPTMTSEFISAVKYSSITFTIGVTELTYYSKHMQEYTFQVFEAFIITGLIYMTIIWTIILGMRMLERKLAVPGLLGAKIDMAEHSS